MEFQKNEVQTKAVDENGPIGQEYIFTVTYGIKIEIIQCYSYINVNI